METGNTYLYGCTDETYQHYTCPKKCGFNSELSNWVGLVYCNDTELMPNQNSWVCHHPQSCADNCPADRHTPWLLTLEKLPPINCSEMTPLVEAFAGPTSLRPFLWLPSAMGESTSWFSPTNATYVLRTDWTPSTAYASTATTSSSSSITSSATTTTSASTGSMPTNSAAPATSVPSAAASDDDSSTVLKVGVGVGVGVGVPLLALLAFLAFWFRRRGRRDPPPAPAHPSVSEAEHARPVYYEPKYDPNPAYYYPQQPQYQAYHPEPAQAPGSPGGFYQAKAELPADQNAPRHSMSPVPLYSEFEAQSRDKSIPGDVSPQGGTSPRRPLSPRRELSNGL
ncbi:hypothetical protein H2199_008416 [Coniosporium tulheliwenetii]|uniref:Uncharacterized protein n=1 Tax=Coniosporium tulheliwenetii TaxID=3383036 RepID=A0ACC2YJC2_9PEZI|nr:hypothetical protein H2199_008416 [Cladosporium sp. JES 115]